MTIQTRPAGYDDGGMGGYYEGQGADLTPHVTYFDPRTQASFVWDGVSDVIDVSLGGYAEPVDHSINSLVVVTNNRIEQHDAVRHNGTLNINWFRAVCERHARILPTYGAAPFTFSKVGGIQLIEVGDTTRQLAYDVFGR